MRLLVGLGLPLGLLSFWMIARIEEVERIALPTGLGIYYHVVIALWLMAWANSGWRRLSPQTALSRAELLCVYSMIGICSSYACWEALGTLLPSLACPAAMAKSSKTALWAQSMLAHMPAWAIVHDPALVKPVWEGGAFADIWRGWLVPLACWGGLLAVLQLIYIAMSRLLWEPWAVHERLAFPLTRLPLAITEPDGALWRSRLFWLAFCIAVTVDLVNGLHQLYPAFPFADLKVHYINQFPTDPGLAAVGAIKWTFHPLMLGLGFLLPTDLSFSTWFFLLLGKLQKYVAGEYGLAHGSAYVFGGNVPGLIEQNVGAFLVLACGWLWSARRALGRSFRAAKRGNMDARTSWSVLVGGSVVLAGLFSAMGIPLYAAVLAVVLIILMGLFVTRLRVELGLPVHNLQSEGADTLITSLIGGRELGVTGMAAFANLHALTRSQQGDPMPHVMEGAYMADQENALTWRFWAATAIAGVAAAVLGPWIMLHIATVRGLGSPVGPLTDGWGPLPAKMASPQGPDATALGEVVVGGAVTLGLILLRHFWIGSPFHPLGYAICGSWGTEMIATPVAVAWLAKIVLLRYGGIKAYRAAVPFALGLVLGEFAAGTFWTIAALVLRQQTYQIWLY